MVIDQRELLTKAMAGELAPSDLEQVIISPDCAMKLATLNAQVRIAQSLRDLTEQIETYTVPAGPYVLYRKWGGIEPAEEGRVRVLRVLQGLVYQVKDIEKRLAEIGEGPL